MIILDTNIVSQLMTKPDAVILAWLDRQPWVSLWTTAVTVLEIRSGLAIMSSGRRRTDREAAFARLIENNFEHRVLPFDNAAAEEAASLSAIRHRTGRPGELRDTMIA